MQGEWGELRSAGNGQEKELELSRWQEVMAYVGKGGVHFFSTYGIKKRLQDRIPYICSKVFLIRYYKLALSLGIYVHSTERAQDPGNQWCDRRVKFIS